MDVIIYSSLSLSTLIGILTLKSQENRKKSQLFEMRQIPVFSPSQIINEIQQPDSQASQFLKQTQKGSSIYKGKIFLEGKMNSKFNIQSVLENKELLFSTFYTDNIYSNDRYFKRNYINITSDLPRKMKSSKSSAPFYHLQDLENNDVFCKVSKNLDVMFLGALNLITLKKHLNKQSFGDKIFVLLGMLVEILNALSHTNLKFRGIKIGFSEIELGLKPNSIVSVFGEVIYNQITNQLTMGNPKYIIKDKSLIIKNLRSKVLQKQIIASILYIPFMFGISMLFRKLKLYIQKVIKQRKDQYLDKLRDFKHLVITDDMRCVACVENVRNMILKPCRHLCICYKCYNYLQKKECPICKTPIQDYVEIFVS